MGELLSVRDCWFAYEEGGFELRSVTVAVNEGEMLGIVGPNGSGKSTLLRIMAGLLGPQKGAVEVRGRPLDTIRRTLLARELAFLPQAPAAPFEFSVREVVGMGRYPYQGPFGFLTGADMAIIERSLRETDTLGLTDRYFGTLSGGEKQRALVASILAQQPSVMLLDEPTASLDIHHQSEVLDLLWSFSRRGIGVVAVTHDLNGAGQFCDRLVLLDSGSVVSTGTPSEVLREEVLSQTYRARLRVVEHPAMGTPLVIAPGKQAHEFLDRG